MRIAVVGATGTAGSRTVAAAEVEGHEVIRLSRSTGVDLLIGAKRAQEPVVLDGDLPATTVRSPQWHEFATSLSVVTFTEEAVEVQDWLIRPIAARTVAEALVREAVARGPGRSIAGPETVRLPDLTARVLSAKGDTRVVRPVAAPLPALSEGLLLAPDGAEILGPVVASWLRAP